MMKKYKTFLFLTILVLIISGCSAPNGIELSSSSNVITQQSETADVNANGGEPSVIHRTDATTVYIPPREYFDSEIGSCHSIVIAEYLRSEDVYMTTFVRHYFNVIEPIKGEFKQKEIIVEVTASKTYGDVEFLVDSQGEYIFTKGKRYVLLLNMDSSIFSEIPIRYYMKGIQIELDENDNINYIESIYQRIDTGIKTLDELKAYLPKHGSMTANTETGLYGALFTESEDLADIVAFSTQIVHVKVAEFKMVLQLKNKSVYVCDVLESLKGRFRLDTPDVHTFINSLEVGKEYILLLRTENPNPWYSCVSAKQNSIIPIEDTERVNKVYELLGIKH